MLREILDSILFQGISIIGIIIGIICCLYWIFIEKNLLVGLGRLITIPLITVVIAFIVSFIVITVLKFLIIVVFIIICIWAISQI